MSAPTSLDEWHVKHELRYLSGHRHMEWRFELEAAPTQITVSCDADWAGDQRTRRSTNGGVVEVGKTTIITYARTQGSVALSSAEAEYVAGVMGIQEGFALRSLLQELGYTAAGTVTTDASAAIAACAKRGLLRFKHLAIKWLFVKELVDRGEVLMRKVPTKFNKADFLTKPVTAVTLRANLELLPSLVWE